MCLSQTRIGVERAHECKLPGFIELQWFWFLTATSAVYGPWLESVKAARTIDTGGMPGWLVVLVEHQALVSLLLYSAAFVASVLSLRPPETTYLYQMRRLAFTLAALLVTHGQIAGLMAVIYKGLIWYFVPSSIVVTNDIFAYFTGVACGRRLFWGWADCAPCLGLGLPLSFFGHGSNPSVFHKLNLWCCFPGSGLSTGRCSP